MNVLIDLDETILDFLKSESEAFSLTLKELDIEPTKDRIERYSYINDAQWKRLEKKEITREEVLIGRFKIFFDELITSGEISNIKSPDDLAKYTKESYEKKLAKSAIMKPGAEELLIGLHKKHDLYLVSNGTAKVQHGRIEECGIEKYFVDIFISQEVGVNKPDKRFFDAVINKIAENNGLDKSEIQVIKEKSIILGDSLSSDIQGGINSGIRTIWYNSKGEINSSEIKPDFIVNSLDEVPKILENITACQ